MMRDLGLCLCRTILMPVSYTHLTTRKILEIIISKYIPEVGKLETIVTDHGMPVSYTHLVSNDEKLSRTIKNYSS